MSDFSRLEDHVEDGTIRLISVVGVPRSISTALGRAISELDESSIFINEPFNRNNQSSEVAAHEILEVTDPLVESLDIPLTVIIKNMASYLSSTSFDEVNGLSESVVWSIRDPLVQIGSLVTRIANDLAFENGSDVIDQDHIEPYLEEVTSFLIDSDLSKNFSRTGWERIGSHYKSIGQTRCSAVVDGGLLTQDPNTVLSEACAKLGLAYDRKMATDWRAGYINLNTGVSRFDTRENAWTKDAANSSGIIDLSRTPLAFDIFPEPLQEHIKEVALPVYRDMLDAE